MKLSLAEALTGYSAAALSAIVQQQGITVSGNKKADAVRTLAEVFARAEHVKWALTGLESLDRQALDLLVMRGGEVSSLSFRRMLLRGGLIAPSPKREYGRTVAGSPDDSHSRYFEDLIARLTSRGLVLASNPPRSYGSPVMLDLRSPGELLFVPEEVLAHYPRPSLPAPGEVAVSTARETAAATFQRDLYLYWRYLRHNEVALTARGLIPKRQLAKIVEGLVVGEAVDRITAEQELGRTFFLRRMLEELGLVQREKDRLRPAATAPGFFALPLAERVRRTYQTWLASPRWNELLRLATVPVDVGNNAYRDATPAPVLAGRQFVSSLLGDLPAGRWIAFHHLLQRAYTTNCDFLFPRDYAASWQYSSYHGTAGDLNPYERYGNALGWTFTGAKDDERGWQLVEGGFIAAVIAEPLHWLGLVDLGIEEGALTAFRLSELARPVIRGEAVSEEAAPGGQVIVQPNFQIFAFDPIGEHVLATLDRFADLVRAEQAIEFRLTRESVYRAQQEGLVVPEIVAFLEQISGRPLPQNVQRTLAEWGSHHERIVVRRGVSVLHSASPELLEALLADDGLAGRLGRRLAPSAVAIKRGAGGLEPLAGELLARGHLPALTRGDQAVTKGAVAVSPEGRIVFRQPAPSIYLWRRLLPFTEQQDGALWLTPAAVERAVARGLGAEPIIAELSGLHHGPLPEAVAERIKVWAKHWGDAALAAVTLLRVKDERVLADLQADPAIGPLLRPYVPQGAVALVRPEDVARLREALEEKGIMVREEM